MRRLLFLSCAVVFLDVTFFSVLTPLLPSYKSDHHLSEGAIGVLAGAFAAGSLVMAVPGGWLVAHTMDISAPLARIMGPRWPWLMDMHIYYFDRRTLPAMFTANGLRVVWQGTQGRYLRLGYLATRVGGLNAGLGRLAGAVVDGLGLHEAAVPVNFGDLITCIGQRPF